MNKWEYKYLWEQEATKVENLIDINGKNAFHIQELYADLKKKDEVINKLSIKLNEKKRRCFEAKKFNKNTT